MTDEFYHKDIFGTVVDVSLGAVEAENNQTLFDKKGREFKIFFKIVWQVKSMLIASRTKDVGETDMKAFPYNKAKSFLKNFKSGELEKLSEDLVIGYHLARRGEAEIETLVEKLLLSL